MIGHVKDDDLLFHLWNIGDEGEPELVVQVLMDGTIEYGASYGPNEAAEVFWKAVRDSGRTLVGELEAELKTLRPEPEPVVPEFEDPERARAREIL